MAVIPTAVSRRTLDTGRGSIPNTRISDAPGRALQSVGSALTAFAARAEQQQSQMSAFKAQSAFVDLQGEADKLLRESQANLVPGAENFHDDAVGKFDELATNFTSGITDQRVRERAELQAKRLRNQFSQTAAGVEVEERNRFFNSELDRMGEGFLTVIDQNPASIQSSIDQYTVVVEDSGLPPVQKQQKLQEFRDLAVERAIQSVADTDPALAKQIMNQIRRIQALRFEGRMNPEGRRGTVKRPDNVSSNVLKGGTFSVSGLNVTPRFPRGRAPGLKPRKTDPKGIIFHHTGGAAEGAVNTTHNRRGYNFIVTRQGEVIQVAPLNKRTNHIRSATAARKNVGVGLDNGNTIAIAFEGSGDETPEMIQVGVTLATALAQKFGISETNIFGHDEVQKGKQSGEGVQAAQAFRNGDAVVVASNKFLPTSQGKVVKPNISPAGNVDPQAVQGVPVQVNPEVVQFTQVEGQFPITEEDAPTSGFIQGNEKTAQELLEPETMEAILSQISVVPNIEAIPDQEIAIRSEDEPAQFLSDTVDAIVQVPEVDIPQEARSIIGTIRNGQIVLSADSFGRIQRTINSSEKQLADVQENAERDAGDAAFKDLMLQSSRGTLTVDEIEANKDILSTEQFSQLLRATTSESAKKSDPTIFADLMVRADEDPEGVQRDALQAFQDGLLTQQDFNKFFTITRSVERQRPVWFKSVKDFVRFSLKPPDPIFDADGSLARRQQQTVLDFEQFFLENPDITFEEARKRAEELVGQATNTNSTEGKSGTKGVQPPPFVSGEVTPEKLRTSREKITEMLNTNQITREEATKLGRDLMIWFNIFGMETGAE